MFLFLVFINLVKSDCQKLEVWSQTDDLYYLIVVEPSWLCCKRDKFPQDELWG